MQLSITKAIVMSITISSFRSKLSVQLSDPLHPTIIRSMQVFLLIPVVTGLELCALEAPWVFRLSNDKIVTYRQ